MVDVVKRDDTNELKGCVSGLGCHGPCHRHSSCHCHYHCVEYACSYWLSSSCCCFLTPHPTKLTAAVTPTQFPTTVTPTQSKNSATPSNTSPASDPTPKNTAFARSSPHLSGIPPLW